MRIALLFVAAASTASIATGCGAGEPLRVVAHPKVRPVQLSRTQLRELQGSGALRLAPSQVAFMTTGSVTCAWWPARLTVLNPTAIQIDMRVNGAVSRCGAGGVGFPIAVKIDPRIVDVHRPLSVLLAYKVGDRQWNKTGVAPAIGRL
jgi:hypothetical protein